jgi:adenylate cyclase
MVEETKFDPEKIWRTYMTTGHTPDEANPLWYMSERLRPWVRLLPSDPRCRLCYYPFEGIGGTFAKHIFGIAPSKMNPQICNVCENLAQKYPGGAEVELSLLFADVRGSTQLAEKMRPTDFSLLINRFYYVASKILFKHFALIEKLIGDQATGFFAPGIAGPNHAQMAIQAALAILEATGHLNPSGPWIPVGIDSGAADIVILGDAANTGARLSSIAKPGEAVVSQAAITAADWPTADMEKHSLDLKGRSEKVDAWIIRPKQEN